MATHEWVKWSDERPTDTKAVYRWRVSPRLILGTVLQPEWSDKLHFVGMGYADNEWWPPCSDWNGFRRSVDATLEWRMAESEGEPIARNGLHLLPCPFTGQRPKLSYTGRWVGAPPYLAESLSLESWMVRSHGWRDATKLAEAWNRRAALSQTEGGGE